MAFDPSIIMGYRGMGELPNPMNQLAQVSQIQNAQNQNALAQYQLSSAQRADEQQRNLYAAAQQPGFKLDFTTAVQYGAPGMAAFKTQQEAQAAGLTQEKLRGEILAQTPKLQNDVSEQFKKQLTNVNDYNSAVNWLDKQYKHPVLGPLMAQMPFEEAVRQIPQNPTKFQEWKNKNALGIEKYIEQNKPTTNVVNRSGQADIVQTPGLDGVPITVGTYADVPLPAAVEAQKARIALAGRAPVQPVAPTITQIVDPTNPNQMLTIDARRYQNGGVGSPGVIGVAGKEPSAALRINKVEQGKTQLQNDLDNLRSSFTELDRLRAIPSTERNVVSNLMSATQASGIGQALGRAGGSPEQVERDVINSARQRLVASIKNASGMSSKSLDSNMELQTMLRSISDPGQSVEAAMRIISDIEDAYVKGAGTMAKRDQTPAATQGTGGFKYLGKESK
jgi:hypothetical protein